MREAEAGLVEKIKELKFRNMVVRELWELEPKEVREEIGKFREELYLKEELEDEESSEDEDGVDDASEKESDIEHDDDHGNAAASVTRERKGKKKTPLDPLEAKAKEYHA